MSNQPKGKISEKTSSTEAGSGKGEPSEPIWSRSRLLAVVFFIITVVLAYCCYLLTRPFLPALAWALALAVVAHPVHCWMTRRIHRDSLAAGLTVVVVAVIAVAPMTLVIMSVLQQASASLEVVQSKDFENTLRSIFDQNAKWSRLWDWMTSQTTVANSAEQFTSMAGKWTTKLVGGSVSGTVNLLIAFFVLFYFLRDRASVTEFVRSILPLSDSEINRVFSRVRDTIFASVYGTLMVAAVQGTLGGLMFWWLGLPNPLLWGVVMGLLAIIPVLGAFVIWIPAAIYLAMQGSWGKAVLLAVWGTIVIGLIDNLLYPVLIGKRLRLHTLPVFISIVGGLIVFGASGLILGPVILALTDATIDVWRSRTSGHRSAAKPVARLEPDRR